MTEICGSYPKNKAHVLELLSFCRDLMVICDDLEIAPILCSSLAVFSYTRNPHLAVNDIDLACSQTMFPQLTQALAAGGFVYSLKPWHVLQVNRGNIKIDFDALEVWLNGLSRDYEALTIGDLDFRVVNRADLTDLYRRGLEATAPTGADVQPTKHASILGKYRALNRAP